MYWEHGLVTGRCPRARATCGSSGSLKCKGLETHEKKEKVVQKMVQNSKIRYVRFIAGSLKEGLQTDGPKLSNLRCVLLK